MDPVSQGFGRGILPNDVRYVTELRKPYGIRPSDPLGQPAEISQLMSNLSVNSVPPTAVVANEGIVKSVLSVDAPEFVPKGYSLPQTSILTPTPVVPVTDFTHHLQDGMLPQPRVEFMNHPVVLHVNNVVVQLTRKPNKFDSLARQLLGIVLKVEDDNLMKEIFTVILEQGIGDENFQYNGARLCSYLATEDTKKYVANLFTRVFLNRIQEEFEVKDVYIRADPQRLCGFTYFMGELYMQFVSISVNILSSVFRESLCHLLHTLMSKPTNSTLKCVFKVLKLAGRSLDATDNKEMESVIYHLKDVAMVSAVSPSVQSLCISVVELRAAGWDKTDSSASTAETSDNAHTTAPMGTVYYRPDGSIKHIGDDPDDSASDNDDFVNWSPPVEELEGEVAEAYEEFLQLQS